jgi:hypothetical protein
MTPPQPRYARRVLAVVAVVVATAAVAGTATFLHHSRLAMSFEQAQPASVGDCVVVAAPAPESVVTRRASCADDPSYTVGAMADLSGSCPSREYQHFPAPAADRLTAGLCLVPNLVADHCYRLGMPIGIVERAECVQPRDGLDNSAGSGVLVQVTRRLDVHDQHACPSAGGSFAWPYPSPARTYCTSTRY